MKIVYVFPTPLTKADLKIYMMDRLVNMGYDIKFLDMSKICYENSMFSNVVERDFVVKVKNLLELAYIIKQYNNKKTLYVLKLGDLPSERAIKGILGFYKCRLARFVYARPMVQVISENDTRKILRKILHKIKNPKSIFESIKLRVSILYDLLGMIKQYDVTFYAGDESKKIIDFSFGRNIAINHWDYDDYLELERNTPFPAYEKAENYIVFIDNFLPYNPDFVIRNDPLVDDKKYFAELNVFFDKLESVHNTKVVIALHPKSKYESNPFGGRTMVGENVQKLIRYSRGIVTHYSTATSYAVLYGKPAVFIFSDEIKSLYRETYYPWIVYFSELLGGSLCNVSDGSSLPDLTVDSDRYMEYKNRFLTTLSNESMTKQKSEVLVDNFLKTYFDE